MMKNAIYKAIAIMLLLAGCQSNVLFDDNEIANEKVWIKGRVSLSDGASAEHSIVFLDGYNVGTTVNEDGLFALSLPPGTGGSDAENGLFKLYIYMGNYEMVIRDVVVSYGKIADMQGDVGLDGWLRDDVKLDECFSINIWDEDLLKIGYFQVDTVLALQTHCEVVKPGTQVVTKGGRLLCGFLLPQQIENMNMMTFDMDVFTTIFTLFGAFWDSGQHIVLNGGCPLKSGNYIYIPWTLQYDSRMPQSFKDYVGYDFWSFNTDYLKVPFVRKGGHFYFDFNERWPNENE